MVVGTAEDEIAGPHRIAAFGVADPGLFCYHPNAEPEFGDRARHDLDLGAHGVGVGLPRAVQAIEVRAIDDVVVDEDELPDTKTREQDGDGTARAAASDDSDPQRREILVERPAEGQSLTVKFRPGAPGAAMRVVQINAVTDDADQPQRRLKLRPEPYPAAEQLVRGKDETKKRCVRAVAVLGKPQQLRLVAVVLGRKAGDAGGMVVDDADGLAGGFGALEHAHERSRTPGD